MKKIGIGLIGMGVVGSGVVRLINENGDRLAARVGASLDVVKVSVKDINKKRKIKLDPAILTDDPYAVVNDEDVDIVVEVMGGEDEALSLLLKAIENKKPVVTANKALLASHGEKIYAAAEESGVEVRYEAAIGGVIPVVRSLSGAFTANQVDTLYGIVNGTCNYILSQMAKESASYDDALADAQRLGFAEADPTFDVEGIDAAHKMAILASLAFETPIDFKKVPVEGITKIESIDIEMANEFGYVIKLLGIAKRSNEGVEVSVHPAMVPRELPIANVDGALNAIEIEGEDIGVNLLVGPGAGSGPTASAIMGDVADIARQIADNAKLSPRPMNVSVASRKKIPMVDKETIESRFYIRFMTADQPGVLAALTKPLGENGVSIASMIQRGEEENGPVAVVMITHLAKEANLTAALNQIEKSGVIMAPPMVLRII